MKQELLELQCCPRIIGHPISVDRFWTAKYWSPNSLKDQWLLDVGCDARVISAQ